MQLVVYYDLYGSIVYYVSFSLLTQDNKSGRSALIHAVENNSIDMVILLIEVCVHNFFSVEFFSHFTCDVKSNESAIQPVIFLIITFVCSFHFCLVHLCW